MERLQQEAGEEPFDAQLIPDTSGRKEAGSLWQSSNTSLQGGPLREGGLNAHLFRGLRTAS